MLLDHFSGPVAGRMQWNSFHSAWAVKIAFALNDELPDGWIASPHLRYGIEVDVGVQEDAEEGPEFREEVSSAYTAPQPTLTLPAPVLTDSVEIWIEAIGYNPQIVGAIELVSPSNKRSKAGRTAFLSKCEALLSNGAGLMVVDVVTESKHSLHRELAERLDPSSTAQCDQLYACSYQPIERGEEHAVQVWESCLRIGEPLPTMPLPLRVGPTMPVDLDATYRETCRELRIRFDQPAAS
ncbi:DUF4058 family protein [Stratiformator vulcanicus]|uniref:DUF4058 domain-containing protein n=1 Tax=Stratiformator vulcanicus TaxID=2527980 RepID=A0A517R6E0_9PLAN|nr:DUF4058 family protein [Stratiformator vulcanicus]QDT39415.1 hypothetical protein Pan189_38220 [Stratiformator vulcanicus]